MMGTGGKFFNKTKAGMEGALVRLVFLKEMLAAGTYARVRLSAPWQRILPIDNDETGPLLQNAMGFRKSNLWVFELEEHIGHQYQISLRPSNLTAILLFYVAPKRMHGEKPAAMSLIFDTPQQILLHVDCIHAPRVPHDFGKRKRIGARSCSKIYDGRSWLQ